MKNKYDVIIVGAGPAGLECARILNNCNYSVLIVEKNATIGPKPCAGGLTGLTNDFKIPTNKTRCFNKQKFFIEEKQDEITLLNPIRTISRLDLGRYQLKQIKDSKNIVLLKNTPVKKIVDNKIITRDNTIFYFKYLVGADGSNSIVRKHLGLKTEYCIGFYYDIPTISDEIVWYIDPKKIKSAYIWTFPHQKHTNIGIYFDPKLLNPIKAKDYLERYLNEQGYTFFKKEIKGSRINYIYKGFHFGNILLAGDAAGLASKGTGEGISFALTSGQEIAKMILDPNHKTISLDKILKIKQRQERMFGVFEMLPMWQSLLFYVFVCLMKNRRFQKYFGY